MPRLSERHHFTDDQQGRAIDAGRIDHVRDVAERAKRADLVRARAVLDDSNRRCRITARSDKPRGRFQIELGCSFVDLSDGARTAIRSKVAAARIARRR